MSNNLNTGPFGIRHLTAAPESQSPMVMPMSYSANLQLNVSKTGNPYHAISAVMAETNTETPIPDGQRPGSDNDTDNY